jgi:pimeloyl-ACP methyl ester carboxylesterase
MRHVRTFGVCVTLLGLAGCATTPNSQAAQASAASPASPATRAAPGVSKQTFVLVHGQFAGGWEWKPVGDLLTAHGHIAYRPTLTGLGEREHLASPSIDLNTHIQDVVNVILFENLHDIVLVGHSYGGMIVTGVADRVPDRIKTLLYVDAALPIDGESRSTAGGVNNPPQANAEGFVGSTANDNGTKTPPYTVRMPAKALTTPIALKNQAAALKIPTYYLMTVDRGSQPEQDRYYPFYLRAKERGWTVSTMTGDHVVHINQTANLVERLEKATLDAKPGTAK